jgi:hypothetical protein
MLSGDDQQLPRVVLQPTPQSPSFIAARVASRSASSGVRIDSENWPQATLIRMESKTQFTN